jgi:UDP-N-acetylmuramate dehydrogenase
MMYHGIEVCNNKERFSIMNKIFYEALVKVLDEDQIKPEEPMKNHVTFRVGGPADFFVTPKNYEELSWVLKCCAKYEMPCYIMGNGSNLLVSDQGYRGVVIQLFRQLNDIQCEGNVIRAQAGALLSAVANRALEEKLTGFEFAAGIPGTLGGACVMNAGAYGGEMKDVLKSVTVLTREGERITLQKNELELGYRTSIIAKKDYIVLEAEIELKAGDAEEIKAVMDDLKERRTTKQPLEYPSAGSTFKRPEGYFAGKLIQESGLQGFQVGGAQVSEKHCGFVINKDQATAADIAELIRQVQDRVEEKFGVRLETEVKRLGEF